MQWWWISNSLAGKETVCFKSLGEKKHRMPGGSEDAVVTSLERRHQQRTLPGAETPRPHSSLPPSTILYFCLQDEGRVIGHENAIGTVVWTFRSRKLKTGFHHTLDRKLLGVWREAWTGTQGSVGGGKPKNHTATGSPESERTCMFAMVWYHQKILVVAMYPTSTSML